MEGKDPDAEEVSFNLSLDTKKYLTEVYTCVEKISIR